VAPKSGTENSVTIGFPVKCVYRGGHKTLGKHGKHFRIEDGKIGYGEFSLSHSIALSEVASVEVTERQVGGADAQTLMAFGTQPTVMKHAAKPKQVTDLTVYTRDGQEALWIIEQRGADWVRKRLTPALQRARIPYYDELSPSERGERPS
jgi:hypothetical protein